MTIAAANTETTYALAGANLGPFASVWTAEALGDIAVWLDTGAGAAVVNPDLYVAAGASPLTTGIEITLLEGAIPGGANWPAGSSLCLQRVTSADQPTSFGAMVTFQPSVFEAALDHVARQIQELRTDLARALAVLPTDAIAPIGDAPARVNTLLGFNAAGATTLYPQADF